MRLSGKVALISGAFSGIGYACAQACAAQGATVYAGDITVSPFASDGPVNARRLDVSQEQNWRLLVQEIEATHGRLHILVNNAGIGVFEDLGDTSLEDWNRVIAVNQTGTMLGIKTCLPLLKAARGSIINISSIFGVIAVPGMAAYHASKGAITAMTRSAAVSFARFGVRANSIHPGPIDTPSFRSRGDDATKGTIEATPLGLGSPDDVAMGVVYLGSDESKFVTGSSLFIDGGYTSV